MPKFIITDEVNGYFFEANSKEEVGEHIREVSMNNGGDEPDAHVYEIKQEWDWVGGYQLTKPLKEK